MVFASSIRLACCAQNPWRVATSLIVTFGGSTADSLRSHLSIDPPKCRHSTPDIHVLLFKRSSTLPSFPNQLVFPGGTISDGDFCDSVWKKHIPACHFEKLEKPRFIAPLHEHLKHHYQKKLKQNGFSPSIALRLCAIRELFEESGLLLFEDRSFREPRVGALILSEKAMLEWQPRLMEDVTIFPELYASLDLCPPISALCEWSNWLTPACIQSRFDTLFFLVQLDFITFNEKYQPYTDWRCTEVAQWFIDTPLAFLPARNKVMLPPQAYELGRLAQFETLEQLSTFAAERSVLGSRRWLPVVIEQTVAGTRCFIVFLPGDERYDTFVKGSLSNFSADEMANDTRRNRLVLSADCDEMWFDVNVYELGHVSPVSKEEYMRMSRSSVRSI